MSALRVTPVFLSAFVALNGCVSSQPVQTPPEPRDPCFHAVEICEETKVLVAMIDSAEKIEFTKIDESSKLLVSILTKSKDPVLLAKLHNLIYERINSDDQRTRKSQRKALSEAGVDVATIQQNKVHCHMVKKEKDVMEWECNRAPS